MSGVRAQGQKVKYRWVVGSGLIGLLLVASAFGAQYTLNWQGAPVEALIGVGTAFMLAGALYFLQRRFVVEVREVVTRTAESVANARVDERVKEVNTRLDELGQSMDLILSERRQRQEDAVTAMGVPTFWTVASALAEANKLGAIYNGHVRVQASYDRDELGLDFSWGTDSGDARHGEPMRKVLRVRAHVYAAERGLGDRWVIQRDWDPTDTAEAVGLSLRDQLTRHGIWKGDGTLVWPMALKNLQESLRLAMSSRRKDGTGWLQGALIERVVLEWAITDAGLEFPGRGVVVPESDFPPAHEREQYDEWPPTAPAWVEADLWKELLRRGEVSFPIRRGPYLMAPTWIPNPEPPAPSVG